MAISTAYFRSEAFIYLFFYYIIFHVHYVIDDIIIFAVAIVLCPFDVYRPLNGEDNDNGNGIDAIRIDFKSHTNIHATCENIAFNAVN